MPTERQVEAKTTTIALLDAADEVVSPANNVARSMGKVVASGSRGLRELLLLVIVARLMDPAFRASRDYAACKPRGLYPAIREALASRGIPHGKDGALNVAKGNPPIDRSWASARKDQVAADEVVRLVSDLEGMTPEEARVLGAQLGRLLLREAKRVADMSVSTIPSQDPEWLASACWQLVESAPDRGDTPQTIVGLLLEAKLESLQSLARVDGIGDSACVTTTTSNKLGDLSVVGPDGEPLTAYEVTIKPFGAARVTDCTAAIHGYSSTAGVLVSEMIVLCRPEDVHPEAVRGDEGSTYLGSIDDQDIRYRFVDLRRWIALELVGLAPSARAAFHSMLTTYVNDVNTSEDVKAAWARIVA